MNTVYSNPMVNATATEIYKRDMFDALRLSFPGLHDSEINMAIDYSIAKRAKDTNVTLDNNYTNTTQDLTLFSVMNYIIEREPIITVSGVMFKRHGSCPNPYVDLIQEFLSQRKFYKKEMFKHPKGSELYERYNILQLSEKVSANAIYGASGNNTCIFYNLYVASTITMQGRSCIAAAILLFESFMANNVKFGSLDEIVTFIVNIRREERQFYGILDDDISVDECFFQLISTCGFHYRPSEEDMMIIWDMLNQMPQEDINRIFYKNNLFWFVENRKVMGMIVDILSTLNVPFIDPNEPPEEIKGKIDYLYEVLKEWVYYENQYMDRIDRSENMYRCVSILTDTDSCFISFDGWYRFILDKTYNIPMKVKEIELDIDTGKVSEADTIRYDYDFFTDEVIELESTIRPNVAGPTVGYRCSIINILAHIMGRLSIDYMNKYSRNSNSTLCADGSIRKSYFILKNEFQLKRIMIIPDSKKNYCACQERQESNFIPVDKALDVKGMPITKIGIPEPTKVRLKQILFNDVLNCEEISQIDIIKQLAVLEKQIFQAILAGSKDYFKPVRIKSKSGYEDPMGQYGFKAAVAYNAIKESNKEPIDLTQRNSILVMKTNINKQNCEEIRESFPEQYTKILELLDTPHFSKDGITKVALPETEEVPEWIKSFINYTEIINDNLKTFPCEALGIDRKGKDSINYTNMITI